MNITNTSFNHRVATVNSTRLHYVIAGQGEPIVLLHGWPETWYAWRKVIPALAEHYTVIVPDMRGFGDSDKPATGYDKQTVADDIYQLVRQLGFQHIRLVGHDMGGPVGYAYAAAHQDEVRQFVFIESLIPGVGYEQLIRESTTWHHRFNVTRDLAESLVEGKERVFLSWFYRQDAYNPTAISESDIDEYVRCYSTPGGMRAGFEYYRAMLEDAEHNQELAKIKLSMPVLAIGGDRGLGSLVFTEMQQVAKNVQTSLIKDCKHWVAEEQPEVLVQQLLKFFKDNSN